MEQEKERREFEEEQANLRAEKEEAGEDFVGEVREWPLIQIPPYKTQKVQYVVCLNTLGQDRQYTEEEKLAALRCV